MTIEKTDTHIIYIDDSNRRVEAPLQSTEEESLNAVMEEYEAAYGETSLQHQNEFGSVRQLLFSSGSLARTDSEEQNEILLEELQLLFPDQVSRYEVGSKAKWLSEYSNYRPPYDNRGISCYIFDTVSETIKQDFSIANSDFLAPFYALKFDTVNLKRYVKVFYPDSMFKKLHNDMYNKIFPLIPVYLGFHGYGMVQDEQGVIDTNIDIYFRAKESTIKEFCSEHNLDFPYSSSENLKDKLMGWGFIYDTINSRISQVKSYSVK